MNPCTVIGGGSSSNPGPGEQISVNWHGFKYMSQCDYVVALDDPRGLNMDGYWIDKLDIFTFLAAHPKDIITRAKYNIGTPFPDEMPRFPFSGMAAVWWAWYKGFNPIHVTGMDLFQDDETYWKDETQKQKCLDRQIRWWKKTIAYCPGIDLRGLNL